MSGALNTFDFLTEHIHGLRGVHQHQANILFSLHITRNDAMFKICHAFTRIRRWTPSYSPCLFVCAKFHSRKCSCYVLLQFKYCEQRVEQVENHFSEMKGGVGMADHEKRKETGVSFLFHDLPSLFSEK